LAAEYTTWWQQGIERALPPAPVNLEKVFRLTGHDTLFILHAPVEPVAAYDNLIEAGVFRT
jgi:hypothetical protein